MSKNDKKNDDGRIALYNKYRPKCLDDIVGQDTIKKVLRNSVSSNNVSHAYLFNGPRGIGKTSIARMLAMMLNCETGQTPDPCGTCSNCIKIAKSNAPDVVELDAASNNSVDSIRAMRQNVQQSALHMRNKIYIIDEAHMLTKQAQNALLKTLEEPPRGVVFVLCTTEAKKLLTTIISRCQRFDLNKINIDDMVKRLTRVAELEHGKSFVEKSDAIAFRIIAESAQGGMRDALGSFERLMIVSEDDNKIDALTADYVREMIGTIDNIAAIKYISHIINGEADKILALNDVLNQSDNKSILILDRVYGLIHDILVYKIVGTTDHIELPEHLKEHMVKASKKFNNSILYSILEYLGGCFQKLTYSPTSKFVLDTALTKVTFMYIDFINKCKSATTAQNK